MVEKKEAKKFFTRMENYLNEKLPDTSSVNEEIAQGKREYELTRKGSPLDFEACFFKRHVVPSVHKFLTEDGHDTSLNKSTPRPSTNFPQITSGSPLFSIKAFNFSFRPTNGSCLRSLLFK